MGHLTIIHYLLCNFCNQFFEMKHFLVGEVWLTFCVFHKRSNNFKSGEKLINLTDLMPFVLCKNDW